MELLFGMTFAKFKLIISKHCVINRIGKNANVNLCYDGINKYDIHL